MAQNPNGSVINQTAAYKDANTNSDKVATLHSGVNLVIHSTKNSFYKCSWTLYGENGSGYIPQSNVKKSEPSSGGDKTAEAAQSLASGGSLNYTESQEERFRTLAHRMMRAFGAPPKFNLDVDIQYAESLFPGYGRVMNRTIMSNPTLISLCPGSVDFLPGFTSKEKDNVYEMIQKAATGVASPVMDKMADDNTSGLGGKLYKFKSAYNEYCKVLNTLCRASAILLGIGNDYMPHTGVAFKWFDYGFWVQRHLATKEKVKDNGIFQDFLDGILETTSGIVNDNLYVHYYVTGNETNIAEHMGTETESSMLEDLLSGQLSSYAKNINYLLGGAVGGAAADEAWDFLSGTGMVADDSFMSKFLKSAKNYIRGGRMVFPQMLGDVSYGKSINCTTTFISPCGDKTAIFMYCMVPILSLLAFALPQQISENMYTYPFICRCYQQGHYNSDLSVVNSVDIERGGSEQTSWTLDGLSTEWTVTFSVLPLYSQLMVTSTDHPLLFMQNDGLLEYLGNLCGVDLKINNLDVKIELAVDMLMGKVKDIPTSLGRGIGEVIQNKIRDFVQIANG